MVKDINLIYADSSAELGATVNDRDVLISDNLTPEEILDFIIKKGVFHLVQKSSQGFENRLRCAVEIVRADSAFINYPVSVLLGFQNPDRETEDSATIFSMHLSDPSEKQMALDELIRILKLQNKSKGMLDDVRLVADELLTNAIYNAPFVNRLGSLGVGQQGNTVKIEPDKKPHLFAAMDDKNIIVGCTDLYGSMNLDILTQRIHQGFTNGADTIINYGPGGAGLGTYLIFNLCNNYYLAVAPGQMTTVCCTIPRHMSNIKRAAELKNFSMTKIK